MNRRDRMPRRGLTTVRNLLLAALACWLAVPILAIHPNQLQGLHPERGAQGGLDQIDRVDLYTGRLAVTLPLGPFALIYNSNVWRYEIVEEDGEGRIRAGVDSQNTGGLGWHLGLGAIYRPQHPYNTTGRWLYVSDDGSRRVFYDTLHNGEGNAQPGVWYTRDGSYLRMTKTTSFYVDVEFPGGTTRRFLTGAASDPTVFHLHAVWSRFASAEDPDLKVIRASDDLSITVRDRYNREHYIELTDAYAPRFPRTVTRVDVEAFGDDRLVYELEYDDRFVDVSCKNQSDSIPPRIRVPHLKRIYNEAEDTAYTFSEDGELLYYNVCQDGIEDLPGVLNGVNLPTGGKIRWVFQEYEFPPSESISVFNSSAGVARRTLLDADGDPYGTDDPNDFDGASWTYKTRFLGGAQTGGHPEVHTDVVTPTGDCSRHFFDAIYWRSSATGEGWEHGLPFVTTEQVGGIGGVEPRYLSSQVFSSHDVEGSCDGDKLRSTYLRFRTDLTPGPSAPAGDWRHLNQTVQASRIVYHDDEDRYADTEHSDFDGLGHFRRSVTTGTFREDSESLERRETFNHYNRVEGTYGTADYQPPAPSEPWLLGTMDYATLAESDAIGQTLARFEYGYDEATGALSCTRVLASGDRRGANDLLQVFERDEFGQVIDLKLYGGDLQELGTEGPDCGPVPSLPFRWVRNTFQYGELRTSRPLTPGGEDGGDLLYDVDLDASTGWVTTQRGPNGHTVTYDFTASGRPASVTPNAGASVAYTYTPRTAKSPSMAVATVTSSSEEILEERQVVFDDFGRTELEQHALPGGTWAEQEYRYNARGWRVAASQWGARDKITQFLDPDPFGRVRTVRPPDGASHDVTFSYQGARRATRSARVELADGEVTVDRSFELDRYGRLRRVEEYPDPDGEAEVTTFAYDVGGRRTEIASGDDPGQVRSFTYDNRGFLLTETHPELGAAGNGTTLFMEHDATGLARRVVDGPHDLSMVYDRLGRLLETRDLNRGSRLITELEYDDAEGSGIGKLWRATRYNYVDLPWNGPGEDVVRVQNEYRYEGLGRDISRKTTTFLDWDQGDIAFDQDFTRNEVTEMTDLDYPRCSLGACLGTAVASGRRVSYTHERGFLTAVVGWAPEIDYHPSGVWQEIHHANGVADIREVDSDYGRRPLRLTSKLVDPELVYFDTGEMTYDGTGNLAAMGDDRFAYDGVGRLLKASFLNGGLVQEYAYDRFGNLTERTTNDGGAIETETYAVDPTTNRLTEGDAVYDAAGNLTFWNGRAFTYDTSNRLIQQGALTYLYDAGGERVASIPNVGVGSVTIHFALRDLGHRILSKIVLHNGEWRRDRDYVYAGARLLARVEPTATGEAVFHHHHDHLGNLRLTTRADGSPHFAHRLLPFGEEWTGGAGEIHEDPMLFAGHERDFSTGNDSMHARHYASELGRFMSVDAIGGRATNPQKLNRYAYGLNNPMRFRDPNGLDAEDPVGPEPFTDAWHNDIGHRRFESIDETGQLISHISTRNELAEAAFREYVVLGLSVAGALGSGEHPAVLLKGAFKVGLEAYVKEKAAGNSEGASQAAVRAIQKHLIMLPLDNIPIEYIRERVKEFFEDKIDALLGTPIVILITHPDGTFGIDFEGPVKTFYETIEAVGDEPQLEPHPIDPETVEKLEQELEQIVSDLEAEARFDSSLASLVQFHCQVSPTTCLGLRVAGLGPFTHFLNYLYF